MWQDFSIMVVNIVFSISLIPQVYLGFREKKGYISLWTSVPTFLGLLVMNYTLYSLDLFFATTMTATGALLWLILLLQRIWYRQVKKNI